jgi:UDP:flavonoid glycosyltransferase YjiC (YdhE family)
MVIHHGGAGTTQSALLAGRPSIIVAHVSDQFFWGAELERLGVAGTTLRRKGLTARQLADGVAQVSKAGGLASRARVLGTKMSSENGVQSAVGLIENLLRRR